MYDPTLSELLISLGINLASDAIHDLVHQTSGSSQRQTEISLANLLSIEGAEVKAKTIIDFLATRGDIQIRDSRVFAQKAINYSSAPGTKFALQGSISQTSQTEIVTGNNAQVVGQGGAQIRQNPDGSITFHT